MLSYILAVTVILGSFIFYMAAFFFPEVHRKGDFIWSGVGLFYALVLWFCAGRITGAVLLGQIASVALVGWLGWQTLQLRRETTPIPEQTKVSETEKLPSATPKMGGRLTNLFKRQPKPTLVIDRKKEQPKVETAPPIATAVTPAETIAPPIEIEALTPDLAVVEPEVAPPIPEAIAPAKPEVTPPKAIEPKKPASSAPPKQGWFANLFKRQPKPTLVIDRKKQQPQVETAVPTPTAVTPAEIVAPPIAIEALTPDREVVEPEETLIQEEAIAPAAAEMKPLEALATEIQPSEEAIVAATAEMTKEEALAIESQLSEEAIAPVAEVSLQEIELPTLETTTELENVPSAAALQGATAEDEVKDRDEDFEEIEEGFEPEPEAPKIEAKAATSKIEPAKGKTSTKPASGGGLADKILAPVVGLFSAVQTGIGGLFSQNKKPKKQSDKVGKTPSLKTQPPAATPDIEETFEEEEFPLEMNAVVEGFKKEEATIQTAGESESLTDEELIAEEESTMDAKEIMEEPIDPEAIAEAISTPETSETKAEEEAIAPLILEELLNERAISESISSEEVSETKAEEAAIASSRLEELLDDSLRDSFASRAISESISSEEVSETKAEEAAIAASRLEELLDDSLRDSSLLRSRSANASRAISESISSEQASETKAEEAAIAPFEMTAQIVEEVKITVEQSSDKPSEVEVTVSIADVVVAVQSVSITETNPTTEPETSTETFSEESVSEAISPNPPNSERVEVAKESAPEVMEETIHSESIVEIAPEVEGVSAAEVSEEAIVEGSFAVEPEKKAMEETAVEEATPSEEEGFAKLVRSNREDAAIVETAKKSAETKITPEIEDSAKASDESV